MRAHLVLPLLFLALVSHSAACSVAPEEESDVAESGLRPLTPAEILGQISYGETKGPVAYTRIPRLRAYWFNGATGDQIKVEATSPSGAVTVIVADDQFQDVPGNTTATLTKTGKHWIAFRSQNLKPAQITVKLTRTNTASAHVADVSVGPYGTCALLEGAGGTRCWGRVANSYFVQNAFNASALKTPANGAMPADHRFLPSHRAIAFDYAGAGSPPWQTAIEDSMNDYGNPLVYGDDLFKQLDGERPLAVLSARCAWFPSGRIRCSTNGTLTDFDFGDETFAQGGVGSTKDYACAVTPAKQAKCWGGGSYGRLGTGDTYARGVGDPDQNALADLTLLEPIDLGAGVKVASLALGDYHACALLVGGAVKCWGSGAKGQLANGGTANVGDQPGEMGASLAPISLEASAVGVFAFDQATCVALANGKLQCFGELPYPLVASMAFASPVKKLVVADSGATYTTDAPHACALLEDKSLRCWGYNTFGALGLDSAITHLEYDAAVGASSLPAIAIP